MPRVCEFARLNQITTKFSDRLRPIIGPWRPTIVYGRFRNAFNPVDATSGQPRCQASTYIIIDAALAPFQKARTSTGSATLTGRKSGSIKRIAPPGLRLATRFAMAAFASVTW